MTTQNNIDSALAVAVQAIPQFINPSVPNLEEYRVRLSADVTGHCRREGLLTEQQFISYDAWYPAGWGFSKLIPNVYEDDGRKHLAGVPALTGPRQYVRVQPSEDLQEKFMANKHPHHPHHRLVPFHLRPANVWGIGS